MDIKLFWAGKADGGYTIIALLSLDTLENSETVLFNHQTCAFIS